MVPSNLAFTVMEAVTTPSPKKARRVSRACDYCHGRSIRCRSSGNGISCQNCVDFGQPCTFTRQVKRRGGPARKSNHDRPSKRSVNGSTRHGSGFSKASTVSNATASTTPRTYANISLTRQALPAPGDNIQQPYDATSVDSSDASGPWQAPYVASQATIMDLVELYFEVVYPIFPFFHKPSFIRSVSRAEFASEKTLFAATMAACALVAARARDGAIFNPKWDLHALKETNSEVFYAEAAKQANEDDLPQDHNLMKAHALLAITAIQYGRIKAMHQHMGRYHMLVAMDGLHDEENWPQDIGIVEAEERRRLFWSIYTLDIYSSVVWGGVIRCSEQQSNVSYPTEADDDLFSDVGFSSTAYTTASPLIVGPSPSRTEVQIRSTSWLCGWNFITDLYRVLEHVITHFRDRRSRARRRSFLHDIFGEHTSVSQSSVRDHVTIMYTSLPQVFKETPPITSSMQQNLFGFQAANIIATIQLTRMVLFAAGGASISDRCAIAKEVVDAFIAVPVAYLQAISSPLMHHLGGIGQMLGSVFEEPLSEADYRQVRTVMLSMAQLLANLEDILSSATASQKLSAQVARIDEYMAGQRANAMVQRQLDAPQHLARWRDDRDITTAAAASTTANALGDTLAETPDMSAFSMSPFQLPPDLIDDWPWTFDFAQTHTTGL